MKTALAAALALIACTSPGVPTVVDGSPATADMLGVSMRNVRVYAVRDEKRRATCWVAVTGTGGDVGISCIVDPPVTPPPSPAATTPAAAHSGASSPKPAEVPVLSPVPSAR